MGDGRPASSPEVVASELQAFYRLLLMLAKFNLTASTKLSG
jgi:hypothetical protein